MKRGALALLAGILSMAMLTGCEVPFLETIEEPTAVFDEGSSSEVVDLKGRLVLVPDIYTYIVMPDYQEKEWGVKPVTPEEVEAAIQVLLEEDASSMKNTAQVQAGDTVVINYVGTIAYQTFDGSVANNYCLTIGSGEMIPGFEDALIGMKVGDTRTFELDGVNYQVTLQSFTRPKELTEEWAVEQGYESIAALQAATLERLTKEREKDTDLLKTQVWQELLEGSRMLDYPQDDLELGKLAYRGIMEAYAKQADMSVERFLETQGLTGDAYEEAALAYAQEKVHMDMILQGILDEQNLSLEDEISKQIRKRLAKTYAASDEEALLSAFGEEAVQESVAYERVMTYLLEGK